MDVKITYPKRRVKPNLRENVIYWAKYPFLIAAIASVIVNLIHPATAWSLIVLWSLWILWSFIFSPSLVEFNRTSTTVKSTLNLAILLIIIYFVYPDGWDAVPIIGITTAGGLILAGTLFFSNIYRQKQNIFPLVFFLIVSIVLSILALTIWRGSFDWPMIVVVSVATALLLSILFILRINIIREIQKRFHV